MSIEDSASASLRVRILRLVSGVALAFAFCSAVVILILDAGHLFHLNFSFRIKSALPLMGIGVSYVSLLFTLRRTRIEFLLGLVVSTAFILWGVEQFIPKPQIVAVIDDLVVFLFVLDLAVVIRGHLTNRGGSDHTEVF